ncbi:MAG: histidine kinase [Vicingaceae bacterium]|nr:histidine kinase [Vicingaceae bacterium]
MSFFVAVKYVLAILLIISLIHFGLGQEQVQHYSYNEDNSNLGSSVCYNWHQLPNGEFYVSGNSGVSRFDGDQFYPFKTEGVGKAISSSLNDSSNRLWCNSFHGDIYYLENGSFVRHPISEELKEVTSFERLDDRFFLRTYTTVYELDLKTLQFNKVIECPVIVGLVSYSESILVFYWGDGKSGSVYNVNTKEHDNLNLTADFDGDIMFLKRQSESYLLFRNSKKMIRTEDFLQENFERSIDIDYSGKINHSVIIDNQLYVSGMAGVCSYSLNGIQTSQFLPQVQVTRFGRDLEGNYWATSSGNGLIQIPSLNVHTYDYSSILDNENIITTIQIGSSILVHGTNAGKIIRHDLNENKIDVLDLNLRSEVLSLAISTNRDTLYAYCDALFEINFRDLKALKTVDVTSIKNMEVYENSLVLGSRSRIVRFFEGQIVQEEKLGWNLSLLYIPKKKQFLTSTKKGLFWYNPISSNIDPVKLEGIETDRSVTDLHLNQEFIYFLYDFQSVYRFNKDLTEKEMIYRHPTRNIDGISLIDNSLFVNLRDTALVLNVHTGHTRILSRNNGLNEAHTNGVFKAEQNTVFVHRNSLTILRGFPDGNKTTPELTYILDVKSTFSNQYGVLVSDYRDNNLIVQLNIRKALRSRGSVQVFYRIKGANGEWKRHDNPFSKLELERLPIGKGILLIKAKNEDGKFSDILEIPFEVVPPFYLTICFSATCVFAGLFFIILFVRWRIARIRRLSFERLKKKQLEARTLKAELTAIRSQMNPHFIFNVLTAIQAKVIEGKADEAYENIGDFAELIRNVLDKSGKEYIFLKEEIALMQNYVELENSRLVIPVMFEVVLDDPEYFDGTLIPTLITQPIIENAIRHAFPGDNQKERRIKFVAKRNEYGFVISISDNGVGMEQSEKISARQHKSFALKALKDRVAILSEHSTYRITILQDSTTEGTEVSFNFEYKQ